MKLKPETRWLLLRRPDLCIERIAEPAKLDLDAAVDWVKRNKPILWVGSVFSVPEPSRFPSGYALTRSLLNLIFPPSDHVSEQARQAVIDTLMPKWPLERLFDEFESLHFDLSDSLLAFFAEHDRIATPNVLHESIVQYYENGLSTVPLCVTTNWDTLLEKAFRSQGFSVRTAGPAKMPPSDFAQPTVSERTVAIYHPHGSFETKDVVCSYFQEQQQLTLYFQTALHPTLFLGYSGYEPSLYRHLEHQSGQLWCVRNESDFEIPAKRRLLCRPNTYVYVGDMRELLKALGILNRDVAIDSHYLAMEGKIPPKVLEVIRAGMYASLEPRACSELLLDTLLGPYDEPEATFRFLRIVNAIDNHIRDRAPNSELPLGLLAAASFRNDEQIWYSLMAHLLRFTPSLPDSLVTKLFANADTAKKDGGLIHSEVAKAFIEARDRCYKAYLGRPEREEDDASSFLLNQYSSIALGDMALGAELAEIAAFTCLRKGEIERATGYFDTTATAYYLTGLWNGGRMAEWASRNIEAIKPYVMDRTLRFPDEAGR